MRRDISFFLPKNINKSGKQKGSKNKTPHAAKASTNGAPQQTLPRTAMLQKNQATKSAIVLLYTVITPIISYRETKK